MYIALMALLACSPEKNVREVVVVGTFVADQSPSLHIYYADDLSPVRDAQVTMQSHNEVIALQWNGNSYVQPDVVISPEQRLDMTFVLDDHNASAQIHVPPAIAPVNLGNTVIAINPNSTGSPALVLQWTDLPAHRYSYLLQLEPLDENAATIPFSVPAGRFEEQYIGPINQTGTILFDTDFTYYGPHRLTIYAIDKSFENVFFYDKTDLRGLALLSPDNITNAKGFLTAVSRTEILLTLQ